MTSTRRAAPRKVTPLMRPARQLSPAVGRAVRAGNEPDALRPDRHRDRGGIVDALRDDALDLPSAQDLHLPAPVGRSDEAAAEQVGGADEAGDEGIGRAEIDVLRRADLPDAALVDDRDPVGQRERLRLVVGHVDGRDADLALQALELAAHLLAQLGVEVGQRLVEQQEPRLVHDGAGERHALLLAAGQPRRRPLLEALQIDDAERACDRRLDLGSCE